MDKKMSRSKKPYSSSSKAFEKSQIILQEIKQEKLDEFQCSICSNQFSSEEALSEHQIIHETPFCELCNKMFKSTKLLRVHQNAHHPTTTHSSDYDYSNNICEDLSLRKIKEEPIELVSEPEIENILNSDPNGYDSEPRTLWRSFNATPPSPFHLDHSSVPLNIKLEPIDPTPADHDQFDMFLNEIMKKPLGDGPSTSKQLSFVGEEMPMPGNLWTQSDSQLEQQNEDWTCDICNRSFTTKQILQRHRIAFHDQNKDFKCDQCDMWFSSSNNHELIKHVNEVHNGFKKFICDYDGCNKEFSRRDALKRHRQTHESQRAKVVTQQMTSRQVGQPPPLPYYNCFDCGLVFRYQTSLILHLKNHKV